MAKVKTTGGKMNSTAQQMVEILVGQGYTLEQKIGYIQSWCSEGQTSEMSTGFRQALTKILDQTSPDEKVEAMQKELEQLLQEIMAGPQKEAAFLGKVPGGFGAPRALVEVDNGDRGYMAIPDKDLAETLRIGDTIMVSMKAGVVAGMGVNTHITGDEVAFTRRIDGERVEIRTRGDDKRIVRLAEDLWEQVNDGTVKPGSTLILNRAGTLARQCVAPQDGFAHYRFLERVPVPNVIVERDIGAPPKCIDEITEVLGLEMRNPQVRRKYKLRRCIMKLLAGVSGAGKTLTIHAIWRRMYEVMAEVTGTPVDQLPPRVFWLRPGRLLSKWFGESEQLIEQAMDEVQALADEKFIGKDGTEYTLPVMVVMEEVDGIARSREGGDQIYNRVLTTLLQRLDPSQPALQQRLILFLGTTNEPGMVDRAFLRRIGGTVEQFGRLDKRGFEMVLDKHMRDLPLAGTGSQAALRRRYADRLAGWLFDVEKDNGLARITINGKEANCNRSDFLTGGLIDRAVQQSSVNASDDEAKGRGDGVTLQGLAMAIEDQLLQLADQLTAENLGKFMTLPDGARVTKLARIPAQPLPDLEAK